jgi:glycosyltransferase involved in cell wall biosynthesis
MMNQISILIPVYNWDVTDFIHALHGQLTKENIEFEIVVFDDGSFFPQKEDVNKLSNVFYSVLETNVGRSKCRNLLAEKARYNWMLFLDGDSLPENDTFISEYVQIEKEENSVYCGGRTYAPQPENKEYSLHWTYGSQRETKENNQKGFQSNNFLIHKSVFENILFDESIVGYGHEDTLFGIQIKEKGYSIRKISAPLRHIGLDDNQAFLDKTKVGVKNLRKIYSEGKIRSKHSKLIEYDRSLPLKKWVMPLLNVGYYPLYLLAKHRNNLKALDLLKLIWFNRN